MIKFLFSKRFLSFIYLLFLIFFVLPNNIQAGTDTAEYDFHCARHKGALIGDNKKNCGTNTQVFLRNDYTAAATSFQILGHRHGGSSIKAGVCLITGNGTGPCRNFSCSGNSCGKEEGSEHPFNLLDRGDFTLAASGGSSNFRLFQTAQVEDAEVRVVGTASADYAGGGSCEPNWNQPCTKSNSCGTRSTNGKFDCGGICDAPTPANDCSLLSCGPAGGNTCDQPGQNKCDGFAAINSSDCSNTGQKCCFIPGPTSPNPGPTSPGPTSPNPPPPTTQNVFMTCNGSPGSCDISSGQNAIIRTTWVNYIRCVGTNPNGVDSWDWQSKGGIDLNGDNTETTTPKVKSKYKVRCEHVDSNTENEIWHHAEVWVNPITKYSIKVPTVPVGGKINSESPDTAINCKGVCESTYVKDAVVVLKATPLTSYWKFNGWAGDCSSFGLNPRCSLTVTSEKSVSASFIPRGFIYKEF